jgi:tetratricopeptide (TPR) repeat protein
MEQGVYYEAQLLLERVLMTYEQELGIFDIRTVSVLQHLARTYRAQGDLGRARDLHARVVTVVTHRLGNDHVETAKAKTDLAVVNDALQDLEQSERLFKEALDTARQLGEENSEYCRIAEMYRTRNRMERGESSSPRKRKDQ